MIRFQFRWIIAALFFFAGCVPVPNQISTTAAIPVTATLTEVIITPDPSATIKPSATPKMFPTITPDPCDRSKSFCIIDGHFVFDRPIADDHNQRVDASYRYGTTQHGARDPHHGVEFVNASGTPVLAVADGQVVFAGNDHETMQGLFTDFYGNMIILEHRIPGFEFPIYTLYGHLSKVDAKLGRSVKAGEKIGAVGASGSALGSHLHFEIRMGGAIPDYASTRNPELWIKPLADRGVLAGRFEGSISNIPIHVNVNLYDPKKNLYESESYMREKQSVNGDDEFNENYVVGDLKPGRYRLTLKYNDVVYERYVEIEAGRLTVFTIVVK
jgi:hypothetical protein